MSQYSSPSTASDDGPLGKRRCRCWLRSERKRRERKGWWTHSSQATGPFFLVHFSLCSSRTGPSRCQEDESSEAKVEEAAVDAVVVVGSLILQLKQPTLV